MPTTLTYPGVYIEELPSGVRTITGVATSVTAFIGSALRGPVNEPTTINNFGDFERLFGGIWVKSLLGYAVRDFYRNGGSQAIVVRLNNGGAKATISIPVTGDIPLTLIAVTEGKWGEKLQVSINHRTKDEKETLPRADLFNLIVTDKKDNGLTETFLNVSTDKNDPRYLLRVLEQTSMLIRVLGNIPSNRPDITEKTEQVPTSPPIDKLVDYPIPATPGSGSDGSDLETGQYIGVGSTEHKTGIYALLKTDLFNLLCIPPAKRDHDTDPKIYGEAMELCVKRRAMLIVDPPNAWGSSSATAAANAIKGLDDLGLKGPSARNAALYFPRVLQADSERDGQTETFVPSGIIAGVMSRTDATRGVWKAPAGIDASLNGIQGLQVNLSDDENGQLNPLGINCLRNFPITGRVVWGARTLRGADQLADEYKYISVRRTALFIEESLYRGTQWVVFEPNDEPLWAQIRLNVGAFMHNLFRQGAFQGTTPKDAYLVKCDKETTTQNDINLGIVNVLVGFAPLKPAEFVIIKIQQLTGKIDT